MGDHSFGAFLAEPHAEAREIDGCLEKSTHLSAAIASFILFSVHTVAVDLSSYLPIGILVVMAAIFAIVNLVGTHILGPVRHGPRKDTPYESGMVPVGTARKRFNVRFYILAMTFLVFDVEIIFLYPWAVTYSHLTPGSEQSALFLGRIMFFIATSIIAYIYAWRKGVFRWD